MKNEIEYNKLVRDKIPQIIKVSGKNCVIHIADDKEYGSAMKNKLLEETAEFIENPCIEEIADIQEVLDALIEFYDFSKEEIMEVKHKKTENRGGFKSRIILEKVMD